MLAMRPGLGEALDEQDAFLGGEHAELEGPAQHLLRPPERTRRSSPASLRVGSPSPQERPRVCSRRYSCARRSASGYRSDRAELRRPMAGDSTALKAQRCISSHRY